MILYDAVSFYITKVWMKLHVHVMTLGDQPSSRSSKPSPIIASEILSVHWVGLIQQFVYVYSDC